jgi:hypothetical protein
MRTSVRDLPSSAYGRFRRALDSRNVTVALATATELDFVSLPDALELVLLLIDDPGRFRRAALRWHARYCGEIPDVGFEEAHAVLACLAGLAGRRPEAAAAALAELVRRWRSLRAARTSSQVRWCRSRSTASGTKASTSSRTCGWCTGLRWPPSAPRQARCCGARSGSLDELITEVQASDYGVAVIPD